MFSQLGLEDFSSVNVQVLGAEDTYGANARCRVVMILLLSLLFPVSIVFSCSSTGSTVTDSVSSWGSIKCSDSETKKKSHINTKQRQLLMKVAGILTFFRKITNETKLL